VVDSDRVIIAGHTRLEAAKRLGMKEVPVHIATDMSPEQVKAWRIADNRVGQEAEWDTELLKLEIGELVDMDFDTDFLGFDED
jgi:ParB-like chromosome segregation protein Spo0J